MPKSKAFIDDSDVSSDDSDVKPKAKKQKTDKKSDKKPKSRKAEDDGHPFKNGEVFFQLGKMRYISVSEYRGKPLVNIREYYDADGEMKPGRKGIALSPDQWKALVECSEEITEALKK